MRNIPNYLIANLSTADMLFLSGIPVMTVTRITKHWIMGDFLCNLMLYMQFLTGTNSICTLMVISVERYRTICLVKARKISTSITFLIVCTIWTLSAAGSLPLAVAGVVKTIPYNGVDYRFCYIDWPPWFNEVVYFMLLSVFLFVMPLGVITVNYSLILWTVIKSAKLTRNKHVQGTRSKVSTNQLRLLKLFLSVLGLFVAMWMPFFVLSFLILQTEYITSTIFTYVMMIPLSNSLVNPVLYGYFNTNFRREFKAFFCFDRCSKRNEVVPMDAHKTDESIETT